MDVRDAIVDLWELAGEPSDLDPWAAGVVDYDPLTELDPDSAGVKYYLRQLSLAQIALSNWKTRKGRPIRFKKFLTQTNIKLGRNGADFPYGVTYIDDYTLRITAPHAGLTEENLSDSSMILNGTYTNVDGTFTVAQQAMVARAVYDGVNDWFTVSLRDQVSNVAYTNDAGTEFSYDSFECEIYWDRMRVVRTSAPLMLGIEIELPAKFRNIIKITNMDDGSDLNRVESKENLFNPYQSFGTPVSWYTLGDVVYFDQFINETIWHTFEYQRLPYDMTYTVAGGWPDFDIPEEWHEVLMLIVEWRGMKRMQDKQRANELYAEIIRWIDTLRTDMEEDWLREQTSGFYIRKEAR